MEQSIQRGERTFRLTKPAISYIDSLDTLLNDPVVAEWLGGGRSRTSLVEAIERERTQWAEHGFGPWLLVDQSDESVIGRGGVRYAEVLGKQEVELFYAVLPACWGMGLGSFIVKSALELAFRDAGVPSVIVFTMPINQASLRVIDKFGFVKEREFEHTGLPHVLFRLDKATWTGSPW